MSKNKSKNKFDVLVESLISKFLEIENFELLSESENTRQLWNYLIQTILEFQSIKSLFVGIYIPQTNKFIVDWKEEFRKSKFSSFVKIDTSLWQYETQKLIRIGYVTMFHKYEGFANSVFDVIDEKFVEFEDKSTTLQQYAQKEFGFKVKGEWHISNFIKRINWICNSEKHNEGFPKISHPFYKENLSIQLKHPESDRIMLSGETLKKDVESMIEFVQIIFRNAMMVALFRMMLEHHSSLEYDDVVFNEQQNVKINFAKERLIEMITLTKEF